MGYSRRQCLDIPVTEKGSKKTGRYQECLQYVTGSQAEPNGRAIFFFFYSKVVKSTN